MKTTALLTLTGTGTVMKLWLTQLFTAGAAAPELLLLVLAVTGLGVQTLHSEQVRDGGKPDSTPVPAATAAADITSGPTEALLRA